LAGGNSLKRLKRIIDRKDFGGELVISETLEPLLGTFDYIIVDTSPVWDPLTVNVLFFVKEVLVPVALESITFEEITAFLKNLSSIQKYRKEVALKYIVPTFYDRSVSSQGNILTRLVETFGDLVCSPIHYCAGLADTPAAGRTTYEFAPGSTGTEDFKNLVRKVGGDDNLLRHFPTNDVKN
jgi:chromosome partitioning protein